MAWWSWGADANLAGRAGYVLGGTNDPVLDAQLSSLPDDVVSVAVQQDAGVGITSSGELWGWGIVNRFADTQPGESFFGDGLLGMYDDRSPRAIMVVNPAAQFPYSQATSVKQAALTQEATFWLRTDGTVWGVGKNWNGEFGIGEDPLAAPNGTYWYHGSPVHLTGLPSGIKWIYAHTFGFGLFAIDSLDRLWYSGFDRSCATGYGIPQGPGGPTDYYVLEHMLVDGLPSSVVEVVVAINGSFGENFSYAALLTNGTVMWWGRSLLETSPPVIVFHTPSLYSGIAGIEQLAAAGALFMRTTTNTLLGIGSDFAGRLCNGTWSGPPYGPFASYTPSDHFALPPVTISLPGGHTPVQFAQSASSGNAMFVVTADSEVWGWGRSEYFWGNGPPVSADPTGPTTVISPPHAVFPDVFRLPPDETTAGCPATDVAVMSPNALFVNACTPVSVAIPSRLATIVG